MTTKNEYIGQSLSNTDEHSNDQIGQPETPRADNDPSVPIPQTAARPITEATSPLDIRYTDQLLQLTIDGTAYKCPKCGLKTPDRDKMTHHMSTEINNAISGMAEITKRKYLARHQARRPMAPGAPGKE